MLHIIAQPKQKRADIKSSHILTLITKIIKKVLNLKLVIILKP